MVRTFHVSDTALDSIEHALNAYAATLVKTSQGIGLPPLVRERARDELVKVTAAATELAVNHAAQENTEQSFDPVPPFPSEQRFEPYYVGTKVKERPVPIEHFAYPEAPDDIALHGDRWHRRQVVEGHAA